MAPFTRLLCFDRKEALGAGFPSLVLYTNYTNIDSPTVPAPGTTIPTPPHLLGKHHSKNEVHCRGNPREHLPGKQEPHVAGGREKPALHKAQLDEVGHEQLNPRLIPAGCSTSLKRKTWRGEQAEGRGPGPVQEHSNRHRAVGIRNPRRGSGGGGDKVRNPGPQPQPQHGQVTPSMVFWYSKYHG